MSTGTTKAPSIPQAPAAYQQEYQEQLNRSFRAYFTQLDNPGQIAASTSYAGGRVSSALNFSTIDPATGGRVVSLPTQADIAFLRPGDVYMDTTAGNALKVAP